MTFLHPEFLYFMLPLIFILFYFLLTQKEHEASFFSDEVLEKLRVNTNMMTLKARNGLFLLIIVLFIVAISQPVLEDGKVKVEAKSADIMVALDISNSMLAKDVYPSRLLSAQEKIVTLLNESKQSRIGVIAFAGVSYLVSPLSFDHGAVRFLVEQLNPQSITQQGTDFLQLLQNANNIFGDSKHKNLLILSDGGDESDFSKEIEYAKSNYIKIFVLALGSLQGAPIPEKNGDFMKYRGDIVISKLNDNIKKLAIETGGSYIVATSSQKDIKAMIKEMDATLQKVSMKEEFIAQYIQLFYIPLGLGMFLLLIATSSMRKRESVALPLLALMLLNSSESKAVLLDFMDLDEASTAYKNKEYKKSASLYEKYAQKHSGNNEALYNEGASLYKDGKYKEAIKKFESVKSSDTELSYRSLHNAGNAYALSKEEGSLQKALKSYERALELKEDIETRQNLQSVKKAIKEQKKRNKKDEEDKKDKNSKDDKESKEQNRDEKKEQNGDEKKESQSSDSKEQESDKSEESSKKDEKSKDEKEEEKSEEQGSSDENSSSEEESKNMSESQEGFDMNETMSDREQKKWLKRLNDNQSTHLYRLNTPQNSKRSEDEKPW
ncbi:MAG: VWA domain-containing protein [Campylobacterota bacterium]|nr:VWA domain-containing protein [Campylobacterota bacterium]